MGLRQISQIVLNKIGNAGKKNIRYADLLKLIPGANIKEKKKKRKIEKIRRTTAKKERVQKNLDQVLDELISFGLLSKFEDNFKVEGAPVKSGVFRALPRGDGYISLDNSSREIKVNKENALLVLDRDHVRVRMDYFSKERWYGKITQVEDISGKKLLGIYHGRKFKKNISSHNAEVLDCPGISYTEIHAGSPGEKFLDKKAGKKNLFEIGAALVLEPVRTREGFLARNSEGILLSRVKEKKEHKRLALDLSRAMVKYNLPGHWPNLKEIDDIEKKQKKILNERELINKIHNGSPWKKLKRRDYSGLFTVTIDGADAKDFDDALSYEIKKGYHYLYVHIADVSLWVAKNSDLDKEARRRGNSTYLEFKVIPMLPSILSELNCSLIQDRIRAVLTCKLRFDKAYNLLDFEFSPGVISVDCRLTYEHAEHLLSGKNGNLPDLNNSKGLKARGKKRDLMVLLTRLKGLTAHLRKARFKGGSLNIQIPKAGLDFDKKYFDKIDSLDPEKIRLYSKPELGSQSLVEEAMLAANQAASRFLKEKKIPALYRAHEKPDLEKILDLEKEINFFGIKWQANHAELHDSLDTLINKLHKYPVKGFFHFLILRSLKQALYNRDPDIGHFGLAFKDYTHFTSPIRRFPDLIVHRQIKNCLLGIKDSYDKKELDEIASHTSFTERLSMEAERFLGKLVTCRIFENKKGMVFKGTITGISKIGFFVTLSDVPVEGRLKFENMMGDYYDYREGQRAAIGRSTGNRLKMGQKIEIKIFNSDWKNGVLEFECEPGRGSGKK